MEQALNNINSFCQDHHANKCILIALLREIFAMFMHAKYRKNLNYLIIKI
jgi:hypothetical protein